MVKPTYQTLIEFWGGTNAGINYAPTPAAKVLEFENKYNLKLPNDFRDYLLEACPIDVDQTDADLTTWWEIDRIKPLSEEEVELNVTTVKNDAPKLVVFADYMYWGWAWAICCKPGRHYGKILQICDFEGYVANNFRDFVNAYISLQNQNVYLPELKREPLPVES